NNAIRIVLNNRIRTQLLCREKLHALGFEPTFSRKSGDSASSPRAFQAFLWPSNRLGRESAFERRRWDEAEVHDRLSNWARSPMLHYQPSLAKPGLRICSSSNDWAQSGRRASAAPEVPRCQVDDRTAMPERHPRTSLTVNS